MKVEFRFRSLTDWSSTDRGFELVDILRGYGLEIKKAGEVEPIRREFSTDLIAQLWRKTDRQPQIFSLHMIGDRPYRFSAFVGWGLGGSPRIKVYNTFILSLSFARGKGPSTEWMLSLGDALFLWADTVQGLITMPELYRAAVDLRPVPVLHYLEGLFWVNYFGEAYVKDERFQVPMPMTPVGTGMRLILAERPDDPRLAAVQYIEHLKEKIGRGWFGEGEELLIPDLPFHNLWRPTQSAPKSTLN